MAIVVITFVKCDDCGFRLEGTISDCGEPKDARWLAKEFGWEVKAGFNQQDICPECQEVE